MDKGRHVDQLDRDRGPNRALVSLLAGADQHQQRPQPLAAGGQGRLGLAAELGPVTDRDLSEAALDLRQARRQPGARGVHHRGDRWWDGGPGHFERVPLWMAMIPPASSSQRISVKPAASIFAASSRGSGKLRTDSGR